MTEGDRERESAIEKKREGGREHGRDSAGERVI